MMLSSDVRFYTLFFLFIDALKGGEFIFYANRRFNTKAVAAVAAQLMSERREIRAFIHNGTDTGGVIKRVMDFEL